MARHYLNCGRTTNIFPQENHVPPGSYFSIGFMRGSSALKEKTARFIILIFSP